ncbi:MAG: chemotaxis protein CheD [Bacteroidales bacterium]|nr:chemotaxis protein CheD [Bacteroidales bacterium]
MNKSTLKQTETIYLLPGHSHTGVGNYNVCTLLGSCVSVCLWDKKQKIGGINHFLFPSYTSDEANRGMYGDTSIADLVDKLRKLGSSESMLEAKIFGGAKLLGDSNLFNTGENNIELAQVILKKINILVVAIDTGGTQGRRICMDFASGVVDLSYIKSLNSNA